MARSWSAIGRLAAGLGAAGLLIAAAQGSAQTPKTPPHRPWAQEHSDLAPDPAVIFGTLANGMRYAIERNTGPPGQVAMRLVIDAGSMQERPDQAGLAHFLEHMAFRGSTHVADGDVRLTLERLGLRFGGDINASTTQAATTFVFNLPENDEASVDAGLMLFREIGSELKLDPASLDAERKVVLSELSARGGPQTQLAEGLLAWQLGDHPYARSPGGDPKIVEAATPAQLRAYYDAYYRPERATLVVVGDIDPDQIEDKVRRKFGDWRGRGAPGSDPPPLAAAPKIAPVTILAIPGVAQSGFQQMWFRPFSEPDLTRAGEMKRFVDTVGEFALRLRLRRMLEPAERPFDTTDALASADIPHVARADTIQAFRVRDLAAAIDFHVRARRQALEYGLTQDELAETLTLMRADEEALIAATSQQSTQIALQLAGGGETIVHSPAQQRALFEQDAAAVTLAQVNAALRARLTGDPVLLYYGPTDPPGGEAGLRATLAKAQTEPVQAYVPPAAKPWVYTDFGPPGHIAQQKTDSTLAITTVRFDNGVRLTVKSTDFARGEVHVAVRFGLGQLAMPRDALGPSDFGFMMLYDGGLKGYTESELSHTLNGKKVAAVPQTPEDAFELTSSPSPQVTPSDQLDLQMQRLAATFTAPAWRPDHWTSTLVNSAEDERSSQFSPTSVYERQAPVLLHSGDVRWVYSTSAQQATWKPEDAAAWMRPIAETAPLEVIIVGDVSVQHAIDAAAKTFGALPARPDAPEPPGLRDVRFPAPTPAPIVMRHKGPADQALVVVAWPGTDAFADTRATQAANLLALVLTNRLIDEIRIKQGKTYSPTVAEQFSTTLPGYGLLLARAAVRPQDASDVMATIDKVAADLAAKEISPDEFARAQGPRLETLRRSRQSNTWWLQNLAGVQTDPRLANLAIHALADTQSLTPADLRAAAARWLVKARSWRVEVLPEDQTPSPAP